MLTLSLTKDNPNDSCRATVEGSRVVHLRSKYSVNVAAKDFVGAATKDSFMCLCTAQDEILAVAGLLPDPMRRDVRVGILNLADENVIRRFLNLRGTAFATPGNMIPRFVSVRILVLLGGNVVLSDEITVEYVPSVLPSEPGSPDDAPSCELDIVDADGVFYLPVSKVNGVQVYRKLTGYDDEYGASVVVSNNLYVKSPDGDFVELEVTNA